MATNDSYIPAEYHTGIVRGDYFRESFSFTVDGFDLDITSATVKIKLKNSINENKGQWTVGNGLSIENNVLLWEILEEETSMLIPSVYKYDIEIIINGKKKTYVRGNFNVEKDITI